MKRLVVLVCALAIAAGAVLADTRPATPIKLMATAHFTLDKNEVIDFSIQLPPGSYYIVLDAQRMEHNSGVIFANIDLLKSNGVLVKKKVLDMTEQSVAARSIGQFKVVKALPARLRVTNTDEMFDGWMTIIPAKQMKFIPFSFEDGALKPLTIGPEGKGGELGHYRWAYHSIRLPAGKWNVSLYFRQKDGKSTSLLGGLERFDAYGVRVPLWTIDVSTVGIENRGEKLLFLTKPQTVIFRVTNVDFPVNYVIGIEKG